MTATPIPSVSMFSGARDRVPVRDERLGGDAVGDAAFSV
jgi:hypothetical protein